MLMSDIHADGGHIPGFSGWSRNQLKGEKKLDKKMGKKKECMIWSMAGIKGICEWNGNAEVFEVQLL